MVRIANVPPKELSEKMRLHRRPPLPTPCFMSGEIAVSRQRQVANFTWMLLFTLI